MRWFYSHLRNFSLVVGIILFFPLRSSLADDVEINMGGDSPTVSKTSETEVAGAKRISGLASVDRVSVRSEGGGTSVFIEGKKLSKPSVQKISEKKILIKFANTKLNIPAKLPGDGEVVESIRSSSHPGATAWVVLDVSGFQKMNLTKRDGGYSLDIDAIDADSVREKSLSGSAPVAMVTPEISKDSKEDGKRLFSRLIDVSYKPTGRGLKIVMTADGPAKYTVKKLSKPEKLVLRFHNTKLDTQAKSDKKSEGEVRGSGLLAIEMRQIGPVFSPITEAILTLVPGTVDQIDRDLNQVVITLMVPSSAEKPVDKKGNINQLVSLDIEGADLTAVVKTLATEANFDVDMASGTLTGVVNEKFKEIPLKSALALLLAPGNYDFEVQGNTLRVGTASELKLTKALLPQITELISPSGGMAPGTFDIFVRTVLKPTNAVVSVADTNRNVLVLKGTPSDVEDYKRTIRDLKMDESSADERITRIVKLNYATATLIMPILSSYLTPIGLVREDTRTKSLVIRETASNMGVLLELVKELDIKLPQVLIESNIVEINDEKDLNLGVNWSINKSTGDPTVSSSFHQSGPAGAGDLTFGTIKSGLNINASIQALETKKKGKVISRPRIATTSGVLATINTVENVIVQSTNTTVSNGVVQITTSFSTLGLPIILQVTPNITDDGRITTDILATITSQSGPAVGGAPPPTNIQTATTKITTKNGETIVIGGLVRELVQDTVNGIPILSSLPIIGAIFQSHEKVNRRAELVIFITPTLLED